MQPEDQKDAFVRPGETEYFSGASEVTAESPETTSSPIQEDDNSTSSQPLPDNVVTWEAPEYLHREKGPVWFVGLAVVTLGLIVLDVLLIKSFLFSFSVLAAVMAAALVVYSHRPADLIHYVLSDKGLHINDTLHGFAEFKGFGVLRDGTEFSVELIPVRRFRPSLAIYFPQEHGEAIVDLLGSRLPMHNLKPDLFDKIIHSLGL